MSELVAQKSTTPSKMTAKEELMDYTRYQKYVLEKFLEIHSCQSYSYQFEYQRFADPESDVEFIFCKEETLEEQAIEEHASKKQATKEHGSAKQGGDGLTYDINLANELNRKMTKGEAYRDGMIDMKEIIGAAFDSKFNKEEWDLLVEYAEPSHVHVLEAYFTENDRTCGEGNRENLIVRRLTAQLSKNIDPTKALLDKHPKWSIEDYFLALIGKTRGGDEIHVLIHGPEHHGSRDDLDNALSLLWKAAESIAARRKKNITELEPKFAEISGQVDKLVRESQARRGKSRNPSEESILIKEEAEKLKLRQSRVEKEINGPTLKVMFAGKGADSACEQLAQLKRTNA